MKDTNKAIMCNKLEKDMNGINHMLNELEKLKSKDIKNLTEEQQRVFNKKIKDYELEISSCELEKDMNRINRMVDELEKLKSEDIIGLKEEEKVVFDKKIEDYELEISSYKLLPEFVQEKMQLDKKLLQLLPIKEDRNNNDICNWMKSRNFTYEALMWIG